MQFSREKKELRRYASEKWIVAAGTTDQLQQPPRHQRPPHLQWPQCIQSHSSYPQPQTSAVLDERDFSFFRRQQSPYGTYTEMGTETSFSTTTSTASCTEFQPSEDFSKHGYSYVNYGVGIAAGENGQSSDNTSYSRRRNKLALKLQKKLRPTTKSSLQTGPTASPAAPTTTTGTMAFATKIFRNLCGVFNESSADTNLDNFYNNEKSSSAPRQHDFITELSSDVQQYFDTLMMQLKSDQIPMLLKAVKIWREPAQGPAPSAKRTGSFNITAQSPQTHCILLPHAHILDRQPHVVVWWLFFWRDLRDVTQLKRSPTCPSGKDQVYVCCNPLHWFRILETDAAPPPYQRTTMERVNTDYTSEESSQNEENAFHRTALNNGYSTSSISNNKLNLHIRMPESLTTDGEGSISRASLVWCKVAYWELSERVGELHKVTAPSINIYTEDSSASNSNEDMCLKNLAAARTIRSPDNVQHVRQKIGLGVTLSQEIDGVWLYNRSSVPVFISSPTLSATWFLVCRVLPGDCLKAFDNHKAPSSTQLPGCQKGPQDRYCMRISFAKGWGKTYTRQEILGCPCWIEVHFNR